MSEQPRTNDNQADSAWIVAGAAAAFVVGGILFYELVIAPQAGALLPTDATLEATPTLGTAPLTVEFVVASGDTIAQPATYDWSFGDGTDADLGTAGSVVSHTYTQAGSYTAGVTITDATGHQLALSVTITANAPVSGLQPVELAADISPISGDTSTVFVARGSLVGTASTPYVPVPNATIDVTLNGAPFITIVTNQYAEFTETLGTLPAGTNTISFTFPGNSTYEASGATQVVIVS